MKKTFSISVNKIRRIMGRMLLKSKLFIILLLLMIGSLLLSIYCIIIGNLVDSEAFQMGYSALSLFIIIFIAILIRLYVYFFKKIKGKGKTVITYEYEFNEDNVIVKNLEKNASFILNKKYIKDRYIINDVLVVIESYCYFFPNIDEIKTELGFGKNNL